MAQSYDASQSELQSGLVERPLTTAILPERPLVAESGLSESTFFSVLNDRFGEKQTFSLGLPKPGCRVAALHAEAAAHLLDS